MLSCVRRPRWLLKVSLGSPTALALSPVFSPFLKRYLDLFLFSFRRSYSEGGNEPASAVLPKPPSLLQYSESEKDPLPPDKKEQEKLSNLGAMIDDLRELVPQLLTESFPKEMVLSEVLLRICPSHRDILNSYLPTIKGRVSYYATCKALQLFFTSLVLNPRVKLHIQLVRTSHFPEPNCVFAHSTKVYMRWNTCSEGCIHLLEPNEPDLVPSDTLNEDSSSLDSMPGSTSKATLGAHLWARIDPEKFSVSHVQAKSLSASLSDLTKGIIGLKKEDIRLERIILGVFVFELNEDNTEIVVHTVEDVNIVEREQEAQGKLRVC